MPVRRAGLPQRPRPGSWLAAIESAQVAGRWRDAGAAVRAGSSLSSGSASENRQERKQRPNADSANRKRPSGRPRPESAAYPGPGTTPEKYDKTVNSRARCGQLRYQAMAYFARWQGLLKLTEAKRHRAGLVVMRSGLALLKQHQTHPGVECSILPTNGGTGGNPLQG